MVAGRGSVGGKQRAPRGRLDAAAAADRRPERRPLCIRRVVTIKDGGRRAEPPRI
jgi:hypothetical protein